MERNDRLPSGWRGRQAAFAELYDACAPRLIAVHAPAVENRADDVLQETAHGPARKTGQAENLTAYVFTVA
jgi:DNA-directed RNA polymerase specialized sigma24 family protein